MYIPDHSRNADVFWLSQNPADLRPNWGYHPVRDILINREEIVSLSLYNIRRPSFLSEEIIEVSSCLIDSWRYYCKCQRIFFDNRCALITCSLNSYPNTALPIQFYRAPVTQKFLAISKTLFMTFGNLEQAFVCVIGGDHINVDLMTSAQPSLTKMPTSTALPRATHVGTNILKGT